MNVRAAVCALPWSTAVIDGTGEIIETSAAWDAMAAARGLDPVSVGVGADYLAVCDAAGDATSAAIADRIRAAIAGEDVDFELVYPCHGAGELHWFRVRVASMDGPHSAVVVTHQNVDTEVRATRADTDGHLGLLELDSHLAVRFADTAWHRLRGPGANDRGRAWLQAVHPGQRDRVVAGLDRMARPSSRPLDLECQVSTPSGYRWVHLRARAESVGGVVAGYVVLIGDGRGADHNGGDRLLRGGRDPLTGLPDRSHVEQHLSLALERAKPIGLHVAVVFLDLDGFTPINDQLGHQIGDEILQEVAARIRRIIRPVDLLARYGGDEFVIIVADLIEPDGVVSGLCDRLVAGLQVPITLGRGRYSLTVGASVGTAVSTVGETSVDLVTRAHAAMHQVKTSGGGRHGASTGSLDRPAVGGFSGQEIERAWRDGQIEVHYQPMIDLDSQRIVAVEALLRWRHPTHGLLDAGTFIDAALGADIGMDLCWWAIERAMLGLAGLDPAVGLFVNIAPRQFLDQGRVTDLAVSRPRLHGRQITLELTETVLAGEGALVRDSIIQLRDGGLRIAIDDFGTGYSSFSRLRYFPTDVIKIDRVLVASADEDPHAQRILRGMVALGHSMEAVVVAEGVEDVGELALLQEMGVSWVQGNLLHPAMPSEALGTLLVAQGAGMPQATVDG